MKLRHWIITAFIVLALTPVYARELTVLRAVPADSVTVGVVHLAELRGNPLARRIFSHTDRITLEGEADQFLREAGFNPMEDIDTVAFSLSPSRDSNRKGQALLVLDGRFDIDKLSAAIAGRGGTRIATNGGAYYRFAHDCHEADEHGAVALVNSTLAFAGEESAVIDALETWSRGGSDFVQAGGLAHLLEEIDTESSAWLLVDVPRSVRLKGEANFSEHTDRDRALAAAMKSVSVVGLWADDNGSELRLGGTAQSNDAETLSLLEDLLRGMLATWRLAAQEKAPELVSEIRKFSVKRSEDRVTLSGEISAEVLERLTNRARHAHAK